MTSPDTHITTPKDSRTMRDCPYPTEIFTEGQIENFLGSPIDDIDPSKSYNLSGVHLWQLLDGYRHLLNTRSDKAATSRLLAMLDDGGVADDIVVGIRNCASAMGITLKTDHGSTEENAWQISKAALSAIKQKLGAV